MIRLDAPWRLFMMRFYGKADLDAMRRRYEGIRTPMRECRRAEPLPGTVVRHAPLPATPREPPTRLPAESSQDAAGRVLRRAVPFIYAAF